MNEEEGQKVPWTASHTAEGVVEIVLQYDKPDLWTCPYLILLRWNQVVYHRYSWYSWFSWFSWQLGVIVWLAADGGVVCRQCKREFVEWTNWNKFARRDKMGGGDGQYLLYSLCIVRGINKGPGSRKQTEGLRSWAVQ